MRYIVTFNIFIGEKIYRNEPFVSIYYGDDCKRSIINDYIKKYCKQNSIFTANNYDKFVIYAICVDIKTKNSVSFKIDAKELFPLDELDDETIEYLLLPAFKEVYSKNYSGTFTDTTTIKGIYLSIKADNNIAIEDFKKQIIDYFNTDINKELKEKLIDYLNNNLV